jgi:hypothetical protein
MQYTYSILQMMFSDLLIKLVSHLLVSEILQKFFFLVSSRTFSVYYNRTVISVFFLSPTR